MNRVIWEGTTAQYGADWPSQGLMWSSYSELYRRQLWVAVVVNKRAGLIARLPLPVYRRTADNGREITRDHPYARLLRKPNDRHDRMMFWTWTMATRDIFGEAFWAKVRDPGGRPIQLLPLHPTSMTLNKDRSWTFDNGRVRIENIPAHDVVHFSTYNPDSVDRGLSPLEPLRATLENEDAARRATSSFWRRGARPGFALSHPQTLSQPAQLRLKAQWEEITAGADKTGVTVVLEEGMKPEKLDLSAEEAQYIETRKLNREEIVAAYDMPPPAVHILDHATFSNITEQFRSVYRDTAAVPLNYFEAVLEMQLRGSVMPGRSDPDFGEDVYAEFLLDEVLRGDFETRQEAYRAAEYMTLAEKRAKENLPFIEGTDRIVLNAASIPLDMLDVVTQARVNSPSKAPSAETTRTLMGRLAWQKSLDEVDAQALTAGLNGDAAAVLDALAAARAAGEDVPALRRRIREMEST
jgi:HK97 family phage portal protein